MSQNQQLTRRRGRPRKAKAYDGSVNVRVHSKVQALLQAIAVYEGLEMPELVRYWFTEMKDLYLKNRRFEKWLSSHRDDLRKAAVNVDLLFDQTAKSRAEQGPGQAKIDNEA